jgi:hypothetical protein
MVLKLRKADHNTSVVLKCCAGERWTRSVGPITLYHKYLGSFEMLCWRKMDKISWTDHIINEEVLLHKTQEEEKYPKENKKNEG